MIKCKYEFCKAVASVIVDTDFEADYEEASYMLSTVLCKKYTVTEAETTQLVFAFSEISKEEFWKEHIESKLLQKDAKQINAIEKKFFSFGLFVEELIDLSIDDVIGAMGWWRTFLDAISVFYDEFYGFDKTPLGPNTKDCQESYRIILMAVKEIKPLFDNGFSQSENYLKRVL